MGPITDAWHHAIEEYLDSQRAGGAPRTTLAARRQHLQHLARRTRTAPYELSPNELVTYCGMQDWARETRRGRRTTFRSFWGWAVASGRTGTNPALALPKVPAGQPRARPIPEQHYKSALVAADARVMLMLRLAAELGLRRAEVAQVHTRDVEEDLLGWSLRVHGKGSRQRVVPLTPGLAGHLLAAPRGYLFPGDDDGHLSPRWVGKLVTNILPDGWTMHTLRHRFATRAYGIDRDVFTVQELLGHASPATTRRYVQIENGALRRTVLAVAS
jgi:integrase